MKNALLHTKFQRAHVAPDIVPRQRLLDGLHEGRHRPLALVTAPAGYGKSTLASRWARVCGAACGWVSLDEEDNDLHQFLSYFLAALQGVFPQLSLHTKPLLEAQPLPPVATLTRYLLNDLHRIRAPFFLILDDYHRITNPRVHGLISGLMEHPAKALHLVLLSRKEPPLPVAAMRGRGLVTEIKGDELRLTPSEVVTFLKQMGNLSVDDTTAAILEDKTEGWPAGLRLAGLYLQGQKDPRKKAEELSGNSTHIADYLFAEVLSRLDPEMVSRLLETAVLDRFCAPLCESLRTPRSVGTDASAEPFIRWLLEQNLFLIGLDDEGYWFRYHHLFQDFLKKNLHQKWPAGQVADLHGAAGKWFAENGLLEEALSHLLSSGDPADAAALIISHRYALMNSSAFARLSHLVATLPDAMVKKSPLLLTTCAFICVEQGNYADAHKFTLNAKKRLEGISPEQGEYAVLQSEVHVLDNLMDIFNITEGRCPVDTQTAFGKLPEQALFVKAYEVGMTACYSQMKGDIGKSVCLINDALSNPVWPPNIQARMFFHLCISLYMDADLAGVKRTAQASLKTIRHTPFFHTRAYANYFQGVALYQQNDLDTAEPTLLKLFKDRHTASPSYVAEAAFILCCIYLSRREETAAVEVVNQARAYCRKNGHEKIESIVLAFEAELAVRRNDMRQARQICKHADFNPRPPLWFFYVPQLTPIKRLLAEDSESGLEEASERLMELDKRMGSIHRTNVRIEILALLAALHHKRKDDLTATRHLRAALGLAEPNGWIRSFVDLGPSLATLLARFTDRHPENAFARLVLDAYLSQDPEFSASPVQRGGTALQTFVQGPEHFLTRRETEILPLLAEGMSNRQLAQTLCVSEETVKTHLKNIFRKLRAGSRIEALNKARELGIFIMT